MYLETLSCECSSTALVGSRQQKERACALSCDIPFGSCGFCCEHAVNLFNLYTMHLNESS